MSSDAKIVASSLAPADRRGPSPQASLLETTKLGRSCTASRPECCNDCATPELFDYCANSPISTGWDEISLTTAPGAACAYPTVYLAEPNRVKHGTRMSAFGCHWQPKASGQLKPLTPRVKERRASPLLQWLFARAWTTSYQGLSACQLARPRAMNGSARQSVQSQPRPNHSYGCDKASKCRRLSAPWLQHASRSAIASSAGRIIGSVVRCRSWRILLFRSKLRCRLWPEDSD